MHQAVMAFLYCLTSSIANAQAFKIEKSVYCDKTERIFSSLKEKYQEEPVWAGDDLGNDSKYALFINTKQGTWTLLQFTPEVSCILGVGDKPIGIPLGQKV
jgi:hypothetical protein